MKAVERKPFHLYQLRWDSLWRLSLCGIILEQSFLKPEELRDIPLPEPRVHWKLNTFMTDWLINQLCAHVFKSNWGWLFYSDTWWPTLPGCLIKSMSPNEVQDIFLMNFLFYMPAEYLYTSAAMIVSPGLIFLTHFFKNWNIVDL